MASKFYLTTAIPYVNAKPHVGHALEYVIADVIARYHKARGEHVFIASGADENALKNVQAAEREGVEPAKFLDKYATIFRDFYRELGVELDEFRRGTDEKLHWPGVQELWRRASASGDIYKKSYTGLYCVGCEAFKTEDELKDGKCPDHDKAPELVEEENYFFRLSKYQDQLIELIESETFAIKPEKRKKEILTFVKAGLEDFSISRSNARARGIGVPVPGDDTQKMYVWFDALNIYQTAIGWGYDDKLYAKWWPAALHVIGKDIIRFHAVYWPAMLRSAKLKLPKELLVHGFITSGGRKMSKSIGNVIDPYELMDKYGVEALRYYLLSQIPTMDDGDLTHERFAAVYTADLQNGLGNLVARVAAMAQGHTLPSLDATSISSEVAQLIEQYSLDQALRHIMERVRAADLFISSRKVWAQKEDEKRESLSKLVSEIRQIAVDLAPFVPATAAKIMEQYKGVKIKKSEPLFPRIS